MDEWPQLGLPRYQSPICLCVLEGQLVKCKGTNVISVRKLVVAAGVEQECLARLSAADVTVWKTVLPMSWLPIDVVAHVFEAGAAVLYPNDARRIRTLGRAIARDNLSGVYRLLLRVLSVPFAIEQSSKLWSAYNDTGVTSVEYQKGAYEVRFLIAECPGFPDVVLEETAGYIEGLIELCGNRVRGVVAVRDGLDRFSFDVHWADK